MSFAQFSTTKSQVSFIHYHCTFDSSIDFATGFFSSSVFSIVAFSAKLFVSFSSGGFCYTSKFLLFCFFFMLFLRQHFCVLFKNFEVKSASKTRTTRQSGGVRLKLDFYFHTTQKVIPLNSNITKKYTFNAGNIRKDSRKATDILLKRNKTETNSNEHTPFT